MGCYSSLLQALTPMLISLLSTFIFRYIHTLRDIKTWREGHKHGVSTQKGHVMIEPLKLTVFPSSQRLFAFQNN